MPKMEFYFLIRTDCEATAQAVQDSNLGERSVRGLLDIYSRENLLGTFYVIPGDLQASPSMYKEAAAAGHEVGLHVHPADLGFEEFLGVYGPDEQRKILKQAGDEFAQVMGYWPKGICQGYASANDYTYAILDELGFTHGTIALPGRILPECASVWAGATLGICYANPYNRILPGWLDFVEIPPTVDPDSRMWGGKHPQDLRVELVDAKNHWYTIAKSMDRQLADDKLPVKYIQACTHNIFEYSTTGDFRRETLEMIVQHTRNIAETKGIEIIPATLRQVAEAFRKKCPGEKAHPGKLKLDTRGRG